jgi:hypothetical protein
MSSAKEVSLAKHLALKTAAVFLPVIYDQPLRRETPEEKLARNEKRILIKVHESCSDLVHKLQERHGVAALAGIFFPIYKPLIEHNTYLRANEKENTFDNNMYQLMHEGVYGVNSERRAQHARFLAASAAFDLLIYSNQPENASIAQNLRLAARRTIFEGGQVAPGEDKILDKNWMSSITAGFTGGQIKTWDLERYISNPVTTSKPTLK